MLIFNLRSILSGRAQPKENNSGLQIGDIVKFHGPVYARIILWEDFAAMQDPRNKARYSPSFMAEIRDGESVCLKTATGVYLTLPASSLERVDPRLELKKGTAVREVDISFLEKSIGTYTI